MYLDHSDLDVSCEGRQTSLNRVLQNTIGLNSLELQSFKIEHTGKSELYLTLEPEFSYKTSANFVLDRLTSHLYKNRPTYELNILGASIIRCAFPIFGCNSNKNRDLEVSYLSGADERAMIDFHMCT